MCIGNAWEHGRASCLHRENPGMRAPGHKKSGRRVVPAHHTSRENTNKNGTDGIADER